MCRVREFGYFLVAIYFRMPDGSACFTPCNVPQSRRQTWQERDGCRWKHFQASLFSWRVIAGHKAWQKTWSFYIPLSLLQTSMLGLGRFHRNQFPPVGLITPSGGLGWGNAPRLYTCFCRKIPSLPPTEVTRFLETGNVFVGCPKKYPPHVGGRWCFGETPKGNGPF